VIQKLWKTPLRREIVLILIVKIILIFAIWWAFFRTSETPTPEQVSHALLSTPPVINKE
jgi:hypothetical protein